MKVTREKRIKYPSRNYLYKVIKNDEVVDRYERKSLRAFLNQIRSSIIQNTEFIWDTDTEIYFKVYYGKSICSLGCVCQSMNEGYYSNNDDLQLALEAFIE